MSLSCVLNMFLMANQRMKACLGIALENHTKLHQSTLGLGGLKSSQVAEMEKLHLLNHLTESLLSSPHVGEEGETCYFSR